MQISPVEILVSTQKVQLTNTSKRPDFNPSSDFSLSSPVVQRDTVIVCLQRLVWLLLPAGTGVFAAPSACFERGTKRWDQEDKTDVLRVSDGGGGAARAGVCLMPFEATQPQLLAHTF